MMTGVASTTNNNNSNNGIMLYDVEKDGAKWIIYWLPDTTMLGVSNFQGNAYELQLDNKDRKEFLGNIAESLLKSRWDKLFANKQLKIEDSNDEAVVLKYTTNKVWTVPRVDQANVLQAYHKVFFGLYNEYQHVKAAAQKSANQMSPSKRTAEWNNHGQAKKTVPKIIPIERRKPQSELRSGPPVFKDPEEQRHETSPSNPESDEGMEAKA